MQPQALLSHVACWSAARSALDNELARHIISSFERCHASAASALEHSLPGLMRIQLLCVLHVSVSCGIW